MTLTVSFTKRDGNLDSRSCNVLATCHEDEYLDECTKERPPSAKKRRTTSSGSVESDSLAVAGPKSPDITTSTTCIAKITISPISHRSEKVPTGRASLGMDVLNRLDVHNNCKENQMEIEEESVEYGYTSMRVPVCSFMSMGFCSLINCMALFLTTKTFNFLQRDSWD